ncbi:MULTISPECIES: hypothetical protein [Streptococcus]|uniref:Uncharacterized protein n=1 Tax=Streptococcus caledonicus TaxID=2614158 RepID=A0ABW0U9N5_9STRE|nr:hypothetical protein [Streptococcus sp. S784/96/1]
MIWKALGDRGFSQYAYEVTDSDLHIILASFDDVDISEIIELFKVFYLIVGLYL